MAIRFESAKPFSNVNETPATSPGATGAPQAVPDLLPGTAALMFSGDPGAMLAALTLQTAHEQEKVSRAERDACARAQDGAEAAEIRDLREKADLTRVQGLVNGMCQLGQAAMSFGSSMQGLEADNLKDASTQAADDAAAERAKIASPRDDMDSCAQRSHDDAIAFKSESRIAQQASADLKGASDGLGAVKTIFDGFLSGAITDKDTDAKAHEMAAQSFKQIAQDAHDVESDAKALLNKALDFYKEYVDTKNQTAMAAIHRA